MGVLAPYGPLSWSPRPILKKREVDIEASIEALTLKLSVMRADSNLDWDELDRSIWVRHCGPENIKKSRQKTREIK